MYKRRLKTGQLGVAKMGRIKRAVLACLLSTFITGGLAASTVPAGACGWYQEDVQTAVVTTWDTYQNLSTYVAFELYTYNNGCGARYYHVDGFVGDGTFTNIDLAYRIWVCGNLVWTSVYQPVWSSNYGVSSPTFNYGSCGRQADNYYSSPLRSTGLGPYMFSQNIVPPYTYVHAG